MPKLRLHGVFLVPHLAVDADVPVLVYDDVVIALVQDAQALQAGGLCGHHVQRLTDTTHTDLQRRGCLDIAKCIYSNKSKVFIMANVPFHVILLLYYY